MARTRGEMEGSMARRFWGILEECWQGFLLFIFAFIIWVFLQPWVYGERSDPPGMSRAEEAIRNTLSDVRIGLAISFGAACIYIARRLREL